MLCVCVCACIYITIEKFFAHGDANRHTVQNAVTWEAIGPALHHKLASMRANNSLLLSVVVRVGSHPAWHWARVFVEQQTAAGTVRIRVSLGLGLLLKFGLR